MPGNVNVDVGGYRGVLDNAATESTLAQLLAETKKSNPALVGAIKQLAQAAGLRAEDIKQFETAARGAADSTVQLTSKQKIIGAVMQDLTAGTVQTAKNLAALTGNVLDGSLAAGNFFRALESLPLGIGRVAALFAALSDLQQKSLDSYRVMTSAGVNFGGSLTTIRMNALSLGLSIEQYSSLIANNSKTFALMGRDANAGAENFQKVAKALRDSPINRQLLAMGLSAEQITQGAADYVAVTGGANANTARDQKALAQSAGEYMTELNALARLTGQTREEQKKAADEAAADTAYQLALSKMSDTQKNQAALGLAAAQATGQKGVVESYRAQISGSLIYTESMKATTAMLPESTRAVRNLADAVKSGTATEKMRSATTASSINEQQGVTKKLGDSAASLMQTNTEIGKVTSAAATNEIRTRNQGITSTEGFVSQLEQSRAAVIALRGSEADQAAETEKAFKDLSLAVSTLLLPVVRFLTTQMNGLITAFKDGFISGFPKLITNPLFFGPIALSMVALISSLRAVGVSTSSGVVGGISKLAKGGLFGAGLGLAGGIAGQMTDDTQVSKALEMAGTGAGIGAMIGSFVPVIGTAIGAALGGAAGGAYGYFGSPKPARALGSFGATGSLFEDFGAKKTVELHGMEAVVTPDQMSKLMQGSAATGIGALADDIQQLNAMTSQVLRTLMTIADNTKRGVDATKSLNGNLFAR